MNKGTGQQEGTLLFPSLCLIPAAPKRAPGQCAAEPTSPNTQLLPNACHSHITLPTQVTETAQEVTILWHFSDPTYPAGGCFLEHEVGIKVSLLIANSEKWLLQ